MLLYRLFNFILKGPQQIFIIIIYYYYYFIIVYALGPHDPVSCSYMT